MIYASSSFDSFKDQIEPECKLFTLLSLFTPSDPYFTSVSPHFDSIWPDLTPFWPSSTQFRPKWWNILGYGWITKELSNISDGKMVVCFGDHTKPDGLVDDYSIKSTLNSIKSLIYRLDTPYMSNKAKSSQQLYDAIRPVIETQG